MIHIFGHKPTPDEPQEFADKEEALKYLNEKLPNCNEFRYLTNYERRQADSILFAFDGELLAELVVESCGRASKDDQEVYNKATWFYDICTIRVFKNTTVRASEVGLIHYHRGKKVSHDIYLDVIERTGGFSSEIENPLQGRREPSSREAGY